MHLPVMDNCVEKILEDVTSYGSGPEATSLSLEEVDTLTHGKHYTCKYILQTVMQARSAWWVWPILIFCWFGCIRSESPSQVLLILIQWLLSLSEVYGGPSKLPAITLAYDNMCNLDKMKIARKPLPLSPPYDMLWLNVHKIIDVFHFPNHISIACKELYSPQHFKDTYPNFNTQAGEQTFAWISRFKRILCSMPKNHHLFYLHRMVLRRNSYTTRCYHLGRKPILPKKRWVNTTRRMMELYCIKFLIEITTTVMSELRVISYYCVCI